VTLTVVSGARQAVKLSILVAPAGVTSIDHPCAACWICWIFAVISILILPIFTPFTLAGFTLISTALMLGRMAAWSETRWLANVLQFADYDIARL